MFLKNIKVITGELQHNLVVIDIDKTQKTEWKPEGQKRKVAKLRDKPYRELFECWVKEIMLTTVMINGDHLKKVC